MPRYAWMAEVRPGCEEEYKRKHDEIWPEMLEALRAAGFRDYWIFRHGLQLVLTFECDDVEDLMRRIQGNPVDARWGEAMAPLMRIDRDPRTGFPYFLPVMFHMA